MSFVTAAGQAMLMLLSLCNIVVNTLRLKTKPRHFKPEQKAFCQISSSHGGEYDVQNYLLGRTAV
jgi:hypothetical protein